MQQPYDAEKVSRASEALAAMDLSPVEELLATHRLAEEARKRFRKQAPAIREQLGAEAAANLARHELNDLVSDLQDAIPGMVRSYNLLLRDPDEKGAGEVS